MLSNINTNIKFISRYITVRSMLMKNAKKRASKQVFIAPHFRINQMVIECRWPKTTETVDQKLGP